MGVITITMSEEGEEEEVIMTGEGIIRIIMMIGEVMEEVVVEVEVEDMMTEGGIIIIREETENQDSFEFGFF